MYPHFLREKEFIQQNEGSYYMVKRIIAIALFVFLLSQFIYSATFTATPGSSLQSLIDNADSGDTIILAAGTYTGANSRNIYISGKSLTIRSEDISSPSQTIIDAENTVGSRIFDITLSENDPDETEVIIEGITFTGAGTVAIYGHGDSSSSSGITLANCIITDNVNTNSFYAGVCLKNTARVDIISCLFSGNETNGVGAGLYCKNCKMVSIVKTAFYENATTYSTSVGAAIFMDNCESIIYDSQIYGNSAVKQGGGIVLNNEADSSRKVRFYNTIINGNTAQVGAGVYIGADVNAEFYNSIICGNDNYGMYSTHTPGKVVVKNCILWDNDQKDIYFSNGENAEAFEISYSIIGSDYTYGKHIITDNPEFLEEGSWSAGQWIEPYSSSSTAWHLGSLSPAIDGGDPNYLAPSTESLDVDGEPRFVGKTIDIGIDEYVATGSGLVQNSRTELWYWTVSDALAEASEGDELIVSPGRYSEALVIGSPANIKISGQQPYNDEFRTNTIIDATGEDSPAVIFSPETSEETSISGLTLTGGSGWYDSSRNETIGGGIYFSQSSPTISFCRIEDNTAETGGAIAIKACNPKIINCIIKNNSCVSLGSAIAVLNGSIPQIFNCAIIDNQTNNSNNSGTGAIHFDNSSAPQDGLIRNCLFNNNLPYAIYNAGSAFIELNSSILHDNNSDPNAVNDSQLFAPDMESFELNYCLITDDWEGNGTDNITGTPQFASNSYTDENGDTETTSHDYELGSLHECLNLGDNDYDPEETILDLDGQERKKHCRVDIGPWEYQSLTGLLNAVPNLVLYNSLTYCSVSEAFEAAKENTTGRISITVTKGTFKDNIIIDRDEVQIAGSGSFQPDEVIIDGSFKVIDKAGPFDEDDPNDPNYMGAVVTLAYGKAKTATISRMTLRGGQGTLDKDGKFKGGAINSRNNDDVYITSCIIEDCAADDGGGIYLSNTDSATITQTIVKNNTATETGGGVYIRNSNTLPINATLLAQNNAENGGGLYMVNSNADIDFCTIADNTSTEPGGGILVEEPKDDLTISNSIIYVNSPDQLSMPDPNTDFDIDYSCIDGGYDGDHIITEDPRFINPAEQNYKISVYSPCFNMADPDGTSAYDLKKLTSRQKRSDNTFNANYDMGAYEMMDILEDYQVYKPVYNETIDKYYYTIQDAINDAGYGDVILLEPGLYQEQLVINKDNLTIKGRLEPANTAMARTIIEAKSKDFYGLPSNVADKPVITLAEFQASDIYLEGLTLVGGKGEAHNFDDYSDPNYSIPMGGGLLSINNTGLTMKWCNITGNYNSPTDTADFIGGGMALVGCSQVKLENCLITNNKATRRRGGAIWAKDIYSSGSGDPNDTYGLMISNCTITANAATDSKPLLDADFTTCGGIYIDGDSSGIILKNSIITENTPTNMYPLNDSENITADHCLLTGIVGTDIYTFDPKFAGVSSYDYHLQSTSGRWATWKRLWHKDTYDSPAIDAGEGTEEQKAAELYPEGDNINIGVYGASVEASLSNNETTVLGLADLNGDNRVDISDLAVLAASWYSMDCFNNADTNRDCIVNIEDMQAFLEGWMVD